MKSDSITQYYTGWQTFSLTFLRILIGWHFLFEGLVKLFSTPPWSAETYLQGSVGPFAPAFKALASNPDILSAINYINIWGLILIGLSLFIGLFARTFKFFGLALLALYYFAYPPFSTWVINTPVEGSYWIVNKNLIEMAALLVLLLFPSSQITGIDRYIKKTDK